MKLGQSEIGQDLGFEYRFEPLDALQFYYDCIFNNEVEPMFAKKAPAVFNWKQNLASKSNLLELQFNAKGRLVNRLEQTRA